MDEDAVQRDLLSKVPPYWQHHRHESYASANNVQPSRIILEDRTEHPAEFAAQLWATGVLVDSYVVVSGKLPSIGDYVVWNCKIATIDGGPIVIRKRYSEFEDLRRKLLATYPSSEGAMPSLPPKSVVQNFRAGFLEKRRTGLEYFINCIILNPEFSSTPIVKEFLFG